MCDVCGCGDTNVVSIELHHNLLAANDHTAAHLREHFREDEITAVNIMGSPGAGKTALLESTARRLGGKYRLAAVSGDLATTYDADRLTRAGVTSEAITTGTACHLDAGMIDRVLHGNQIGPAIRDSDFFFIENVGNLVCPAAWDLGETAKIVVFSVTEGEDKPLKYPDMFAAAKLMILNKTDLLPYLKFDVDQCIAYARRVNPKIEVLQLSATSGQGMDAWLDWIMAGHAMLGQEAA